MKRLPKLNAKINTFKKKKQRTQAVKEKGFLFNYTSGFGFCGKTAPFSMLESKHKIQNKK
jgi:hypothetical protein